MLPEPLVLWKTTPKEKAGRLSVSIIPLSMNDKPKYRMISLTGFRAKHGQSGSFPLVSFCLGGARLVAEFIVPILK